MKDQHNEKKDLTSKKKAKYIVDEQKKNKPSKSSIAFGRGTSKLSMDKNIICILKCMIKFKVKKDMEHSTSTLAFHELSKGKFQSKVSKT